MIRSRYQRLTSVARLAVVVAFVHQLGACGCGCLDHNWWYQSAAALLADGTPSVALEGLPVAESFDCEGALGVDCLAPARGGLRDSLAERFVAALPTGSVATDIDTAVRATAPLPRTPILCATAARATVWRL
jgi:hypothetical protein